MKKFLKENARVIWTCSVTSVFIQTAIIVLTVFLPERMKVGILAGVSLLLVVFYGVFVEAEEKLNKKEIAKLKEKLDSLAKYEPESIFERITGEESASAQLFELCNRAEKLGFCFRCRLYQEKVQEDKRSDSENERLTGGGENDELRKTDAGNDAGEHGDGYDVSV